mgnify:CR=1 FL=1
MNNTHPIWWLKSKIEDCTVILDNKRKPVSSKERAKRQGEIPYYGATGRAGWIDNYIFNEELILLGEDGAPFFDITKNVAYLISGKSWVNNHAHVLKGVNNVLLNKFLLYFLNQFDYKGYVGGTTRLKLNQGNLKSIPISLPPLAEQERIVAKLDDLMTYIERSKERLESLYHYKSKFINSCLVNPSSKSFYKREKLGEYLEVGKERIGENWKNCLKIGVSAKKGIIDLAVGQKKTFEKYKVVHPGDFIYNTMRVNIGSIAIYHGTEIAITSPDYVVFRVKKHLSKELLLGFLKSEQGQLEIGANTKGSVRSRLYFKSLSEVRMPISDLKTQKNAELFLGSLNHSLKKIKDITYPKLENLKQSILAKAFRGELVEQDENDEPASVLLERIKAEKVTLVTKKNKIKKTKKTQKEKLSINSKCPLLSILEYHSNGLTEQKLYAISKMPSQRFLVELNENLKSKKIIQTKEGLLVLNSK